MEFGLTSLLNQGNLMFLLQRIQKEYRLLKSQ